MSALSLWEANVAKNGEWHAFAAKRCRHV